MGTFNRGRLRHQIKLQRLTDVLDSAGDVVQDPSGAVERIWVTIATPWAEIAPLSAREFIASQATQDKITTRIVIGYRAGVDAGMRAVHSRVGLPDVIYNIAGPIADPDSGLEWLSLACSTGVNSEGQ